MRPMHYSGLLTLTGILSLGGQMTSAHAQVNTVFTFTGTDQNFVVPTGITSLDVRLWGAAGGTNGLSGGGGAYVRGILAVTPGEDLSVLVGQGGGGYGNGGWPDGGESQNGIGAGGGGRSALQDGGSELVDAGAGGGGNYGGGKGGAGGIASGEAGGGGGYGGGGGTQTQGGAGGADGFAFAGGQYSGGWCPTFGGGGGDGYYGGGGSDYGGGGGGSSYTTNDAFNLTLGEGGVGSTSGNTTDPFYIAGVGDSIGLNGGNGEVVISYNLPASSTPEPGSMALFVASGMCAAGSVLRTRRRRANVHTV